ncbi:hypothetical protein EJ08DRAFT_650006 [Tothia fuscella]|uniref:Uncharacterized protein n=1 Tax=Tothia fuscella TaxID=1048955 RepID=A0A9P4TYL3_9PEZI|nr:hypothetical protein EJ08DRAFT_650006 [Tothia fuscella]
MKYSTVGAVLAAVAQAAPSSPADTCVAKKVTVYLYVDTDGKVLGTAPYSDAYGNNIKPIDASPSYKSKPEGFALPSPKSKSSTSTPSKPKASVTGRTGSGYEKVQFDPLQQFCTESYAGPVFHSSTRTSSAPYGHETPYAFDPLSRLSSAYPVSSSFGGKGYPAGHGGYGHVVVSTSIAVSSTKSQSGYGGDYSHWPRSSSSTPAHPTKGSNTTSKTSSAVRIPASSSSRDQSSPTSSKATSHTTSAARSSVTSHVRPSSSAFSSFGRFTNSSATVSSRSSSVVPSIVLSSSLSQMPSPIRSSSVSVSISVSSSVSRMSSTVSRSSLSSLLSFSSSAPIASSSSSIVSPLVSPSVRSSSSSISLSSSVSVVSTTSSSAVVSSSSSSSSSVRSSSSIASSSSSVVSSTSSSSSSSSTISAPSSTITSSSVISSSSSISSTISSSSSSARPQPSCGFIPDASFESSVSSWNPIVLGPASSIDPYKFAPGAIDGQFVSYGTVGATGSVTMSNTISAMKPGLIYTLDFHARKNSPISVEVLVDGVVFMSVPATGDDSWKSYRATFIASTATSDLKVVIKSTGDAAYMLDNFRIKLSRSDSCVDLPDSISSAISSSTSSALSSSTRSAIPSSTSSALPPPFCGSIPDPSFEDTSTSWDSTVTGGATVYDPYSYGDSFDGDNVQYGALDTAGSAVTTINTITALSPGVSYTIAFYARREADLSMKLIVDGIVIATVPAGGDTEWKRYSGDFIPGSSSSLMRVDITSTFLAGYMLDAFSIAPKGGITCVNP